MSEKTSPATSVPHIPWAYPLQQAPRLPVTGEEHPLRREFGKWLSWASALTLVLAAAAFGLWLWLLHREPPPAPVARQVAIVRYTDLGVPPSIARPSAPQVNVAEEIAKIEAPPPVIAVPEPVADEQAQTQTIATQAEIAEALEPLTLDDLQSGDGAGDSLVVEVDIDTSPAPDEFVPVEEEPVRIRIDPPVYPDVARTAGVEGTVLVRVLVGKDGRVKDVLYIDGPEALKEAAFASARSSVWKPAQMDHKPVEVWVLMPVTFKLRN